MLKVSRKKIHILNIIKKFINLLDPDLLSYLTKSLVHLSTNHKEIITNESTQLRRLLANTSLNDEVRVRTLLILIKNFLIRIHF